MREFTDASFGFKVQTEGFGDMFGPGVIDLAKVNPTAQPRLPRC